MLGGNDRAFLASVVPWPSSSTDEGWVNVHYSYPDKYKPGKLAMASGWPFKDISDYVSRVDWALNIPDKFKDMWFCTSLQRETKKNRSGKTVANRKKDLAISLKAIWLDVDIKDDPNHYPDLPTALKELLDFIDKVKLPKPSAIVYSGGGMHVYWISREAMLPDLWLSYAQGLKNLAIEHGLKCDAGLTTDAARILRIPGTLNYKYDPPKPVTMAPLPLVEHDFPLVLAHIQTEVSVTVTEKPYSVWFDKPFANPDPAYAALDPKESLAAGIDKQEDFKVDPRPVFQKCGFYKHALKTGGADYDQPLWMLSVLGTTFMENGYDIAHQISSNHVAYSEADTTAMYNRKMADRIERGVGYPSCATIQGHGCKSCETCPLVGQGKSPLNIRPEGRVTATVKPPTEVDDYWLPEGFGFNEKGWVCKEIEVKGETFSIPIFKAKLWGFWLSKDANEYVNFMASADKGCEIQVKVEMGAIGAVGFFGYLMLKRVLCHTDGEKYLKEFFVSVIGTLREQSVAQKTVPFGWYEEEGKRVGFCYAGKLYMEDGTQRPCAPSDPNLALAYRPHGTLEDWRKAADSTFNRMRPELTCIALTAFSAPLMAFTDKNSILWSAVGTDTAAGKSSAATIGMSVWGNPNKVKGTERTTVNNTTTIMKNIRNLPFYWDEVTKHEAMEVVAGVMMEADGGVEKGRNIDGERTQNRGDWQLQLCYSANFSMKDFIRQRSKDTPAQLMRCLEWQVDRVNSGPGQMVDADAQQLLMLTRHNYGTMGQVYAEYLGKNHKRIAEEVKAACVAAQADLNPEGDARVWFTGIATMICAASYAKDCGLAVDPAAIKEFLYATFRKNYADLGGTSGHVPPEEVLEDVLSKYISDRAAQDRGLWTDWIHLAQGKPKARIVVTQKEPQQKNMQGGVVFRFANDPGVLCISKQDFEDHLTKLKRGTMLVYKAMEKQYHMKGQLVRLGSGTAHDPGRVECLVLRIGLNTPLWNQMVAFTDPGVVAQMVAARTQAPVGVVQQPPAAASAP